MRVMMYYFWFKNKPFCKIRWQKAPNHVHTGKMSFFHVLRIVIWLIPELLVEWLPSKTSSPGRYNISILGTAKNIYRLRY